MSLIILISRFILIGEFVLIFNPLRLLCSTAGVASLLLTIGKLSFSFLFFSPFSVWLLSSAQKQVYIKSDFIYLVLFSFFFWDRVSHVSLPGLKFIMYVRLAFSLSSCLCPPNPRIIGIALFCLVLFSVGCQRFPQSLVSSFLAPSPLSYNLPKSLALTAINRVERVASSVSSCLLWCLEQFVDCVFSNPSSLNLVITPWDGCSTPTCYMHKICVSWRPGTNVGPWLS